MPVRVLVTGFEPFGGAPRNPSGDVACALHGRAIHGATLTTHVLPVLWDVAGAQLRGLVREEDPQVVLCLGMALATYRVERYADNARIKYPDNGGRLPDPPRAKPTVRLPSRLPVASIEAALTAAGARVEASEDAGGFICNEVFFTLMSGCHNGQMPGVRRGGFLHVPNDRHAPELAAMVSAVEAAIETTLEDLD